MILCHRKESRPMGDQVRWLVVAALFAAALFALPDTVFAADTTPPSVPSNVNATAGSASPTIATITWDSSTDDVGVSGYYVWRSLTDSGAHLALGSDFPVEQVNPMLGIYAAVTRQDVEGWPPGGWYPDEALTREEAVRGFTLDAAYSGFMEHEVGSLERGKRADFIVLDRDVFEVPAMEIAEARVLQTWLDGELVFERQ